MMNLQTTVEENPKIIGNGAEKAVNNVCVSLSSALRLLFTELERVGIKYCVVNNYETLPDHVPTDVDIAIEPDAFYKIDRFIIGLCELIGWKIIQKILSGYGQCAFILSDMNSRNPNYIQLDFFFVLSPPGFPKAITSALLLEGKRRFRCFFIPRPEVELLLTLFKRIIKQDISNRHLERLKLLSSLDEAKARELLGSFLGEACSGIFWKLIQAGELNAFTKFVGEYRKPLQKLISQRLSIAQRLWIHMINIRRLIKRCLHPVGCIVVFLSPDGGGKSTVARCVLQQVQGAFHGGSLKYFRPGFLPAMGSFLFWRKHEETGSNPRPHDKPLHSALRSTARFLYYVVDFTLGYYVTIFKAKVKKQIVVFDRYYYDYLVDLKRHRMNIPRAIVWGLLPLIPAPDITIYLKVSPEEMERRKTEIDRSELERQGHEFDRILKFLPNARVVVSESSLNETVADVTLLILQNKAAQARKQIESGT